jgi:hypothetical protein
LLADLFSTPVELTLNALRQPRPKAGAERTLSGVGWTQWLGAGEGRDMVLARLLHGRWSLPLSRASNSSHVIDRKDCCPLSLLHRPFPLYPFNSFFSSVRKRHSVPCSMIFWGLDLIMPASCRRRA